MVFSSPIFLFIFLPFVWILHAMLPERFRKAFLLFASLMFYIYGEGMFVMLMLATILTAHFTIVLLYKVKSSRKTIAVLGSALSLAFLLVFKHMNFFTTQLSNLFALFSSIKITPTNFHLPLGVSFFTFQAVSCIIDFYRNPEEKEPKFIDTALYIAFFPQLVAGPIVRYDNFIPQLKYRAVHYAAFLYGLKRFAYGFAKKVLISNNLSPVVEKIYSMDTSTMGIDVAWAATFVFMVELYFDFSGYSDMAIGLARMFGIKIPENFTYPFTATSIGNMWRKWHISLSTWFRDYIYIPLGGSRKGEFRAIVNIWISFLACGFGFMFVVMSFIQNFTLLFGNPAASGIRALSLFLVFSALGSLFSKKILILLGEKLFFGILLVILPLTVLGYAVAMPHFTAFCTGFGFAAKFFLIALFAAPLAFTLGTVFPVSLLLAGEKKRSFIPLAFSANGAALIFAYMVLVIIAMAYGFKFLFVLSAFCYFFAVSAMLCFLRQQTRFRCYKFQRIEDPVREVN